MTWAQGHWNIQIKDLFFSTVTSQPMYVKFYFMHRENIILFVKSGLHAQHGCHAHKCSKIFSRTSEPIFLILGMWHQGPHSLFKWLPKDDLDLFYCKVNFGNWLLHGKKWKHWTFWTYCSLRPETWQMQTTKLVTKCFKIRLQVSVLRTNGPLVVGFFSLLAGNHGRHKNWHKFEIQFDCITMAHWWVRCPWSFSKTDRKAYYYSRVSGHRNSAIWLLQTLIILM